MTYMPQTMLVCLCGTPVLPKLGGIRGGRTVNVELDQFHQSLDRVQDVLASRHREAVKQQAVEVSARRQSVEVFHTALARVERALGKLQARLTSKGKARGRTWQVPRRQASSKSLGRDHLALELQKRGFTFQQAGEVVDVIWDSIKKTLQRGEAVETPLGRFEVKDRPEPRKRWRWGKLQRLCRQRKKVVFTAAKEVR
jgi:nucleoid DNA-binding protein